VKKAKNKIITIIGTRPEIIKMSALLPLLDREYHHILVHSGQHYSINMDKIFFKDLKLRAPDICLEVGTKSPALQLAEMIAKLDKIISQENPSAVIVHGDTNTTLAGALATVKNKSKLIKLIHVEAGYRSFNEKQTEEINRQLVDHIGDLLFVANNKELDNIKNEGINLKKTIVTGNTVIDSCLRMSQLVSDQRVLSKYKLQKEAYILMTFHRQETVDDKEKLKNLCHAVKELASTYPVVLPLHPRTVKMLAQFNLRIEGEKLILIEPVGYKEMIGLLKYCRFCLTDSGGLQEEAAVLGIPCLILREETEHTLYVGCGINKLVSTDAARIIKEAKRLIKNQKEYLKRKNKRPKVKKNTQLIIMAQIKKILNNEN